MDFSCLFQFQNWHFILPSSIPKSCCAVQREHFTNLIQENLILGELDDFLGLVDIMKVIRGTSCCEEKKVKDSYINKTNHVVKNNAKEFYLCSFEMPKRHLYYH